MTRSPRSERVVAASSRRIMGPVTLTRPVGALKTSQATRDKVAVQLPEGTSVQPVEFAEADAMIEVRTSDSQVYTIFKTDLTNACTAPPAERHNRDECG